MNMFYSLKLTNLVYLDIETTMITRDLQDAPENVQKAWEYKFKRDKKLLEIETASDKFDFLREQWKEQGALYPEFSKVICISMGGYGENGKFFVKAFHEGIKFGDKVIQNELDLLEVFKAVLDNSKYYNKQIIAHNGKGFDYPFLVKRAIINRTETSKFLHTYGKKPWDLVALLDSQEIWQFTSRSYTSLNTIAAALGLPSPKEDMDGSEVWKYYYDVEDGMNKIGRYCNNDVVSLAQVMLAMVGDENLQEPQFILEGE